MQLDAKLNPRWLPLGQGRSHLLLMTSLMQRGLNSFPGRGFFPGMKAKARSSDPVMPLRRA